jgi:Terminase large subunit, T4likevirus-type, N-terminal
VQESSELKLQLDLLHAWTLKRLKDENPEVAHLIKKPLHEGQLPLVKAIFYDGKRECMMQCGRSFGKTEEVLYIATRWAISRPKQIIYILCPERKQAKEIYWASRRLQDYAHKSMVAEERDSELRLVFTNGSFICIDGSDNYKSLRGVKPNLVVYDEFQDHDRRVDEAMRPNLGSKRAPLIRIGTPPEAEGYYTEVRQNIIKHVKRGSPTHFYLERPTSTNPYFDPDFLITERERLSERGELDQYLREYEAKFIPGGAGSVFPMFHGRKHAIVKSQPEILKMIHRDRKNMNWFTVIDPGQSCFAVTFACVNKYTSQIFLLDEIYEKNRHLTSSGKIWPRIKEIQKKLCSIEDRWSTFCDEAASWFPVEIYDKFNENIYPTKKAKHNKKDDISFIKDLMYKEDAMFMSSTMPGLIKELESYVTKQDGSYSKANDHQIDNLRYLLSVSGFKFFAEDPEIKETKSRPLDLNQLLQQQAREADPFGGNNDLVFDEIAYEWH